jgi:hypothetical protein
MATKVNGVHKEIEEKDSTPIIKTARPLFDIEEIKSNAVPTQDILKERPEEQETWKSKF